MTQYIDKDTLVAEIKRLIDRSEYSEVYDYAFRDGNNAVCVHILNFLDTLEVKDVELEKEIHQHINDCLNIKFPTTDIKMIAKDVEYTARKFFELGLKVQKGE